jgi:predicted permease
MPATFLFPDREVDLWCPVGMGDWIAQARQATWYVGIGRLRPGVTPAQARANLAAVQAQLARRYPEPDRRITAAVAPLKETTIHGVRASLWLLYGAVSLLLLITCTNIAALLLSRASHRRHEIAVRLAIGASRTAVVGQMLAETAVLAALGGALGLVAAAAAARGFRTAAADLPRADEIAIHGRMLFYALVSTMTVAALCGLLPAIRTASGRLAGTTNDAGRTQVSARSSVQWVLVATEVALSVSLLAGAALLVRSLHELFRVNPGFDATGVMTFRVSGTWNETVNYDRLVQRIDRTLEELRAVPGVVSASTSSFLPGVPAEYESTFDVVEAPDAERHAIAESRFVSADYFATMRIAVTGGERCRQQPFAAAKEVMVNRTFVNRYLARWPSAAGLHLSGGYAGAAPERITGVVADARERGLDREPPPIVYMCFDAPNPMPYFLVRTAGAPAALAPAVRAKVKDIDPFRAVYDVATLEDRIGAAFTQNRLRTMLLACFAIAALLLACLGLYGTLSYVVSARRREIGLRLALGARRGDIVRQFVLQAVRVVGLACVCGLAIAWASARALSGMLFGVSPSDPAVLGAVTAFVLIVATVSALVPATRAALIAPMRVLRED